MLSFENDYMEGAHEQILKRLVETNMEKHPGYGTDIYTESAKGKIREAISCPEAEIFFLTGGTQTNQVMINTMLEPYEGVIAAGSGHVEVHEAGAIEFSGHKVLRIPGYDGKLVASDVRRYIEEFFADGNYEHMVFPGMVYISHPTEYGTLYTKKELEELSKVCKDYEIPLYLDGARLGYALACPENEPSLSDIAEFCDAFYIGATKVGAFIGEAVVFTKHNMPRHFNTRVKQHGALLAKGKFLGIQFDTLFTDDLYIEISKNAITQATKIREALEKNGFNFFIDSPTNQLFVIMENDRLEKINKEVKLGFTEKYDEDHTVMRFCTSWATTDEDVEALIEIIEKSRG